MEGKTAKEMVRNVMRGGKGQKKGKMGGSGDAWPLPHKILIRHQHGLARGLPHLEFGPGRQDDMDIKGDSPTKSIN